MPLSRLLKSVLAALALTPTVSALSIPVMHDKRATNGLANIAYFANCTSTRLLCLIRPTDARR